MVKGTVALDFWPHVFLFHASIPFAFLSHTLNSQVGIVNSTFN
jgi:hypothetical protein